MKMRLSLRDIARLCDVHVSTVSLALRDSPRLPKETRERIQAMARELGYRPDPMLDALVAYRDQSRRRVRLLGCITDWDLPVGQISHHRSFHRGALQRAEELGFLLESFSLRAPGMSESRLNSILATRNVEGLILSAYQCGLTQLNLDWERFSVVRIELQPESPAVHAFAVDHVRTMAEAMMRARSLGYRRPGLVLGQNWSRRVEDHWEMAYAWSQRALPLEARIPVLSFDYGARASCFTRDFEDWFTTHRPDVVLGPHPQLERVLRELRLRIPTDLAVIDCFLEQPNPFYAGMVHQLEEVGRRAVDALSDMVLHNRRGIPAIASRCYVESRWQPGPSCPSVACSEAAGTKEFTCATI